MTRVTLRTDAHGDYTVCESKGHSGYAEEGSDIVCAAVSALCITCLNSLEALAGLTPAAEGGSNGYLRFALPREQTETQRHDAQLLMSSLRLGLEDIAREYPSHLKLTILNGGKQS